MPLSRHSSSASASTSRVRSPLRLLGEPQDPPKPLSDEEWLELQGRVAVAGSARVERAVKEAQRCAQRFVGAAAVYRLATRRNAPNVYEEGGPRETMDKARTAAYDAIDAAERAMRDELADL
jgi:hypothetical protein